VSLSVGSSKLRGGRVEISIMEIGPHPALLEARGRSDPHAYTALPRAYLPWPSSCLPCPLPAWSLRTPRTPPPSATCLRVPWSEVSPVAAGRPGPPGRGGLPDVGRRHARADPLGVDRLGAAGQRAGCRGRQAGDVGVPAPGELRMSRMVSTRRDGTQVIYRLENEHVGQLVADASQGLFVVARIAVRRPPPRAAGRDRWTCGTGWSWWLRRRAPLAALGRRRGTRLLQSRWPPDL
jgi:hypothetical protein